MLKAILLGGSIAGVLDITDALVFFGLRGASPVRLLQNIASGLLGRSAFEGGLPTAALGVVLHFTIAFGAAIVYNMASIWTPSILRYPWRSGPVFGLLVYAFMNFVVLPMSRVQPRQMSRSMYLLTLANLVFAHIVCVGLPIALAASRYQRRS